MYQNLQPHLRRQLFFQHWLCRAVLLGVIVCGPVGCKQKFMNVGGSPLPAMGNNGNVAHGQLIPNPLNLPVADREFAWSQLTDEIDDYFRIRQSERVRTVDNVLTDGWLETYPRIGSTMLEGWAHDSTPGFEKLHATLQTVRRWARVRVVPTGNSYQFDVQVYKELEDMEFPQHSTIGSAIGSHSTTPHFDDSREQFDSSSYGWIPLGRDKSLEQQILSRLQARLTQQVHPARPARWFHRHQSE